MQEWAVLCPGDQTPGVFQTSACRAMSQVSLDTEVVLTLLSQEDRICTFRKTEVAQVRGLLCAAGGVGLGGRVLSGQASPPHDVTLGLDQGESWLGEKRRGYLSEYMASGSTLEAHQPKSPTRLKHGRQNMQCLGMGIGGS